MDKSLDFIRKLFPFPAYVVLPQVQRKLVEPGCCCGRIADVIIVGRYATRGNDIIGIECKKSRSDWASEFKNPDKADEIGQHCDRWYLYVENASVVHLGELPTNWGLIVACKTKAKIVKEAPELHAGPIPKSFLATILSRVMDYCPSKEMLKSEYERGLNDAKGQLQHKIDTLTARIATFEEASGVKINNWENGNIGKAVSMIIKGAAVRDYLLRCCKQLHKLEIDVSATLQDIDRHAEVNNGNAT